MRALLTLPPARAKPSKIEPADRLPGMRFRALRPKRTEASFVMRTRGDLRGRVDMKVKAFVAVAAVESAGVLVAFWHAA